MESCKLVNPQRPNSEPVVRQTKNCHFNSTALFHLRNLSLFVKTEKPEVCFTFIRFMYVQKIFQLNFYSVSKMKVKISLTLIMLLMVLVKIISARPSGAISDDTLGITMKRRSLVMMMGGPYLRAACSGRCSLNQLCNSCACNLSTGMCEYYPSVF